MLLLFIQLGYALKVPRKILSYCSLHHDAVSPAISNNVSCAVSKLLEAVIELLSLPRNSTQVCNSSLLQVLSTFKSCIISSSFAIALSTQLNALCCSLKSYPSTLRVSLFWKCPACKCTLRYCKGTNGTRKTIQQS